MFTHLTPSHFPITWNYQNILSIVRFKLYRSTFEPIVFFSFYSTNFFKTSIFSFIFFIHFHGHIITIITPFSYSSVSTKRVAEKRGERKLISARYAAHRPPEVPEVAAGRVNVSSREAQAVGEVAADDRTRPVVAAAAEIVNRSIVHVAGPHKP